MVEESVRLYGRLTDEARQRIVAGIQVVQSLPRCYVDAERCRQGVKALRAYRWKRNEDQTPS